MTLLKPIHHFICASLHFSKHFQTIWFDFVVVLFIVLISTKTTKYRCQMISQKPWTFHHFFLQFFFWILCNTKMDLIYPIKRKSSANLVFFFVCYSISLYLLIDFNPKQNDLQRLLNVCIWIKIHWLILFLEQNRWLSDLRRISRLFQLHQLNEWI